jgi:23S rRNA pseudouridine1911/1915/1917 synthase
VVVRLLPEDTPAPVLPEDHPIDVLFEDDYLLALQKPAGVVSHPTFGHPAGSLLNAVLFHARNWPSSQRPSLVGRLDKLTSGVILVAKSSESHARLQRTLADGVSSKEYLAIVRGTVQDRGSISLRLRRDPRDRRRVVADGGGIASLTRFEKLASRESPPLGFMRCELVTGRMHQIRVHFSASGWPIVGDRKYSASTQPAIEPGASLQSAIDAFPRQALHAWRLSFPHPFTREHMMITAPLPQDMHQLIADCGWKEPR